MAQEDECRRLTETINHWNANRLDLFEISPPNLDLDYHGVMRFYFQDKLSGNFATKCIRVASTATTHDVIETLAEKFRPDIRMLTAPRYSLYEVHSNGEERRLDLNEKPLIVQLNWTKDDREGRFVLKNENDVAPMKKPASNGASRPEKEGVIHNFRRSLSKKDRDKEKKRREREASLHEEDVESISDSMLEGSMTGSKLAEEVYKEMPETSFTRTISNPDAVMKRRRQQRMEKRMQDFHGEDGRPVSGGMLRIFADSLRPSGPTLAARLAPSDTADVIVREMLDKYELEDEDPRNYCLAQVVLPPGADAMDEASRRTGVATPLSDDDCPLQILAGWSVEHGTLVFQLRRRGEAGTNEPQRGRLDAEDPMGTQQDSNVCRSSRENLALSQPGDRSPYLVELNPDGTDSRDKPKVYRLKQNVTEVGSEPKSPQSIQLLGAGVLPQHCVLTNMDGVVTVTPSSIQAETLVDGRRLSETSLLRSGAALRFGNAQIFKFVDPVQDLQRLGGLEGPQSVRRPSLSGSSALQETTFDLDGDVRSNTTRPGTEAERVGHKRQASESSLRFIIPSDRPDRQKREQRVVKPPGIAMELPASLELTDGVEEAILASIIHYTNSSTVHFKLSPTYSLYLASRWVLAGPVQPEPGRAERARRTGMLVSRMAATMETVVQEAMRLEKETNSTAGSLAFWMANASELLNFMRQDRNLGPLTPDSQDALANTVQVAFRHLVDTLQADIAKCMPDFLVLPEDARQQNPTIGSVLHMLSGAMALLRRCRVNAALTIQLFSQLFHFINMWLFNRLVRGGNRGLCSHFWGQRLRHQLEHVEAWAEKQGLELAADCHLSRLIQATTLLTMDKYIMKDVPIISNTCFKLNSLQLRALLENYQPAPNEPPVPQAVIDSVVAVAERTADELTHSDEREVQLEEDPDLQLPFLLPEDGYSCDIVRGIPNGLQEFLNPLCQRGLCRLVPQPRAPGTWMVFFEGMDLESLYTHQDMVSPSRDKPEVVTVTLRKQNGLGLSIVAARGSGEDKMGIYVKSVVKGGSADRDGRLAAGDQLLCVDGNSLVGLSQERAAELMTRTGSVVTLEVAKQGAIYHGLATLLHQGSPSLQRAAVADRRGSGKLRPKSDGFALSRHGNGPDGNSKDGKENYITENSSSGIWHTMEQRRPSTEDWLVKNRTDHRSTPNVAAAPPIANLRPGAPTSKIQSVSTGDLKAQNAHLASSIEAFPIPTSAYPREYNTLPPARAPDPSEQLRFTQPVDRSGSSPMQRVAYSEEELWKERRGSHEVLSSHESLPRELDRHNSPLHPHRVSPAASSSSSSELLVQPSRTGPGRWHPPGPTPAMLVAVSQPMRAESRISPTPPLPPPPPPTYVPTLESYDDTLPPPPPPAPQGTNAYNTMPLPLPPTNRGAQRGYETLPTVPPVPGSDHRDEQQHWYEREKAQLEEERKHKQLELERREESLQSRQSAATFVVERDSNLQQHSKEAVPSQKKVQTTIRELRPQQQPHTVDRRDLLFVVPPNEVKHEQVDPLSPSPWKRDEKEKREKLQQQELLGMLEREIWELKNKTERSVQEGDRLRKLLLEREFQRRLQETRRHGDDDDDYDDEEEDDDWVPDPKWQQRQRKEDNQHRLQLQEEERARQQKQAEDRVRQQQEAEDRVRQQQEAEDRVRQQREAEDRVRQQREAEDRVRQQREAEDRVRQQREAEDRVRQQREAEDRSRQQQEAEQRARQQQEAEQRARQQQEAEQRARLQREAEERAQQQREVEDRAHQQREAEDRARRFEEQRQREGDYNAHMETERRRQQNVVDHQLMGADLGNKHVAPPGRDKQLPPTPPQRNSMPSKPPDSVYTATMIRCGEGDERDVGMSMTHALRPPVARLPRPLSDGYALATATPYRPPASASSLANLMQHGSPLTFVSPGNSTGMNSYSSGNTPGVIGSQEVYRDPRDRLLDQQKGPERVVGPEKLTFRERQRLFSEGKDVSSKMKTSRKLMELEQELGNQ
uniref:afadin isoform X2 n=1 Tax=Myxine glutinosa TaxID=7769 RepID=UPI00358E763A